MHAEEGGEVVAEPVLAAVHVGQADRTAGGVRDDGQPSRVEAYG
ncbi:hypothetical protein OH799_09510 [Nocardia sp. NBC_00881]|nr:hypothetical protein OH799_09510 [Nocardia sp. NBC_00881]